MITQDAVLSIARISLSRIQAVEFQARYPGRCLHYVKMLLDHPDEYAGFLSVQPSKTHADLFELLDGYHRYTASILAGRSDALCVIVEEAKT